MNTDVYYMSIDIVMAVRNNHSTISNSQLATRTTTKFHCLAAFDWTYVVKNHRSRRKKQSNKW